MRRREWVVPTLLLMDRPGDLQCDLVAAGLQEFNRLIETFATQVEIVDGKDSIAHVNGVRSTTSE